MNAVYSTYSGYRYTVTRIANGAKPRTAEAELWYAPLAEYNRWRYFRRCIAESEADAEGRVEAEFKAWVNNEEPMGTA